MRVILQSEAAECGLASLAMVADHHGLRLGLAELRRRFALSLKGIRLDRLVQIAQQVGFSARALRVQLEDLPRLAMPCILHWDLNHFVVLVRAGRSKVVVYDPALGERHLGYPEVSERFTGVALELTPAAEFRSRNVEPSISLARLTGSVRGLWRSSAQVLALSVALQVFVVLAPFFMQWVVDQVLVSADRDMLAVLGIGFGLALLLQVAINLLRGWSVVFLSSHFGLQWMGNIFGHLLCLPLEFFEKRNLGDIVSRLNSVREIKTVLTTSFLEAIIDGLMAVITLTLMLMYSWKLALVTLAAVGLYAAIRAISYKTLRDRTEQQLTAGARQQTYLLESLRGIQSLKVAGQESSRRATNDNLMVDTVNEELRLAKMGLGYASASQLVFGAERIAVIWIGAMLAMSNVFSVGMLVAYLAYKDLFAQRVGGLVDAWIEFRMLRLHAERLSDIALAEPEEMDDEVELPPPVDTRIEVENLSFRYGDGEPWVLRECSFVVEAGESVAITGESGCGKTTLVKLMLGLLKPTEGRILIGGRDLHGPGMRSLRNVVGAVMQDDQLFAGSIADNIGFFGLGLDQERIERAARLASIHEEVVAMPMGYHSLIGDMGSSLSGGQKQRIILARALYRDPRLLFLDEATSHLDVGKERRVNEAVKQMQLTKVIVAHRPETIDSADRVLVVEKGRVVTRGVAPGGAHIAVVELEPAGVGAS
ncbi:peptidase domain-containing ABC transporter [Xanthomonas sp. AmX2]|uniref:peptidase domain-containing ABC transporter n=1 Tax=Xanthomonas sp. TaxID=29446 RepID=UPI00197F853F|nr:peptidase domain-containing ABC transporter [Xanthomonas sp.]MBN6150782.1 peptidase domain-containing ABC transporter [Xanthomonas sp.]